MQSGKSLRKMLSSVTKKCSGVGDRGDSWEGELAASTENPLPVYSSGPTGDWEEPAREWEEPAGEWEELVRDREEPARRPNLLCSSCGPGVADPVSPLGRAVAGAPRVAGTSGVWLFPSESLMDGLCRCSLGAVVPERRAQSSLCEAGSAEKKPKPKKQRQNNMSESHTLFAFFSAFVSC